MTQQLPQDLRWIAFDLDDTLHHFRRASTRASEAVFCDIERQFGIGVDDLGAAYREILSAAQSRHFSQPKTSREYLAERFGRTRSGRRSNAWALLPASTSW
jgi:putative hydrolase of the HAD superfamily